MRIPFVCLFWLLLSISPAWADPPAVAPGSERLPVSALLGEKLNYDISFLWFKKIARGEIRLEEGDRPGTYLATLKAETRGIASFFTRHRIETYTTLMEEGPDGQLRPLLQVSDTRKGRGSDVTHRRTSYTFDFDAHEVIYRKTIDGEERLYTRMPMAEAEPVYDFLTAFYNLRLGRLGKIEKGRDIRLAAYSRKGPEKIVVCRAYDEEQQSLDIADSLMLCKVLISPEIFKSNVRDVYVGFDAQLRPLTAVVKDVIGLGDVRGELVNVTEPLRRAGTTE